MLKHLLVPMDGSDFSEKALKYARDIVDPKGKLSLLTVIDQPYTGVGYMPEMMPMAVNHPEMNRQLEARTSQIQDEANGYLEKYARDIRDDSLRVFTVVSAGEPAEQIIEKAKDLKVDAIVMATHGRTGLSRWFMGSVTQRVLSATTIPVLVVPNPKRDR